MFRYGHMWFAPAMANDIYTGNYMYNIGDLGIWKSLELCPLLPLDVHMHAPVVTLKLVFIIDSSCCCCVCLGRWWELTFTTTMPCQAGWQSFLLVVTLN